MIRGTPELSWLTGATTGVTMVTTETKLARANTFYPIVIHVYCITICFACVFTFVLPLLHQVDQILKGRLKLHKQSTKRTLFQLAF